MSGIMNMFVAAKTTVAAATDAFFNRVTLLLNTGSTNGAQNNTFLDSSTANAGSGWTITRNGNTTQGTFTPFSQTGWSNYFGGSGNYLTRAFTSTTDGMYLQGSTYTIEAWIYPVALSGFQYIYICNAASAASYGYTSLYINGSTLGFATRVSTGGTEYFVSSGTVPLNQWSHISASVSANTAKLFLNGAQVGTNLTIAASTFTPTGAGIGFNQNGAAGGTAFTGYISNLRLTQGGALYTGNFTPSTTPLTTTVSSGTVSFLTAQSNRFLDTSSNGYTLAITGTPSVQAFSPFAPTAAYSTTTVGGSGYFDGTVDYLTVPNNTAFNLSTSDFTISFWVYPTTTSGTRRIIQYQNGNSLNSNYSYAVILNNSNQIAFFVYNGTTSYSITSAAIQSNSWNFVTVTRSGSTGNLYVNNVNTSGTLNSTINNPSGALIYIGSDYGSADYMSGYVSDIRVVKGAATAPGANPTSPLTNITNTSLLLNYTNAGIYDAAAKNDLETVGNAQVSTTQAKFGTTSMYFDGTGDYLTIPNGPIVAIGSGDFTIECWWYPTDLSASSAVWCLGDERTANNGLLLYWSSGSSKLVVYSNGAAVITSSISTPINSWYYLSVVRSGSGANNLTLYVNGSSAGTATNTTSFTGVAGNGFCVNAEYTGSFAAGKAAYIDELRITKGYARPSTTPTAAFPVQ